jgi:hypothetical protein
MTAPSPPRARRVHPVPAFALAGLLTLESGLAFAAPQGPKATAQPSPPAPEPTALDQAAALKKEGNDALGALRPGDALAAYRKAYALTPDPALHYNMGHALEALGDYPGALEEYEEFARVAPSELRARVPRLDELIAEVRARVTVVTFRSNVPGARVLVRDVAVGTTGPDGSFQRAFPAGPATFEVVADGYAASRRSVTFEPGAAVTFDAVLVTRSTAGVLRVMTSPVPGDVYIDDHPVGRAPVEATVAAGTHRIVVRRSGLREVATQAVVDVGDTREISVDLEPAPPLYTQWWVWAGAAVVVAGGVALTYAALKERSADSGSIAPGQTKPLVLRF